MIRFFELDRRLASVREDAERRVENVLASGRLILGPAGEELERAFAGYVGVEHAVGVASGTDAIRLALVAAGVGPGAEVITVANTCAPTISAVLQAGAVPVLVDVDAASMTMDAERAEAAVGPRTRALLPVHLYGQPADLSALRELAGRRGLLLVEDCAQAHGAEHGGRRVGGHGELGCFSFYPTKNLGALGDAGAVTTSDGELAERLRLLRFYGYERANEPSMIGFNSRLDEVQAAVLLAGLERLEEWNARRRAIAARYHEGLSELGLELPAEAADSRHVYHLYVVRTPERDGLRARLHERGVETLVHYPVPIHRMAGYAEASRVGPGGLPVTDRLAAEVLSLPLYPELTDREVDRVIDAVRSAARA